MKAVFALALVTVASLTAADAPPRPKIVGVAHIALSAHDMKKSAAFYQDFLGYQQPFRLENADGSLAISFIKINDRQYIELSPETGPGTDRLKHIALEVESAEQMRAYLRSKGVKVPDQVPKGRTKNSNFMIKDPDGHQVEIVQYEPDGFTMREKGKFIDGPRISTRIAHVGINVGTLAPALKFYGEILGLQEFWRGSKDGKVLSWVNMKLPESDDYIELMLYDEKPSLSQLGTQHHICLEVASVERAAAQLEARKAKAGYTKPLEVKTGVNRKRQMNLYDADGTRTEVMEPKTIDGVPTPPSTAAPPR